LIADTTYNKNNVILKQYDKKKKKECDNMKDNNIEVFSDF
jgi:hypothetical protein